MKQFFSDFFKTAGQTVAKKILYKNFFHTIEAKQLNSGDIVRVSVRSTERILTLLVLVFEKKKTSRNQQPSPPALEPGHFYSRGDLAIQ